MNCWTRFSLAVRRRETPFYDRLYRIAKACMGFNMPVIPGLHRFLYAEWDARTRIWHNFWRVAYYEPMFKSRCRKVGKNFRLEYAGNGICRILGNLQVVIGDNVYTFDNISLSATRVFDDPKLTIGDKCFVGPACRIHVAGEVTLGSHSILGSRIFITDNTGHPPDAYDRLVDFGGLPARESVRPVVIGEHCFFGAGCCVYPGAVVGDGVIARAGTHVIGTIPPFAVIGGNPGKVSRLMAISGNMREFAGEERYREWIAAQDAYLENHPEIQRERSQ